MSPASRPPGFPYGIGTHRSAFVDGHSASLLALTQAARYLPDPRLAGGDRPRPRRLLHRDHHGRCSAGRSRSTPCRPASATSTATGTTRTPTGTSTSAWPCGCSPRSRRRPTRRCSRSRRGTATASSCSSWCCTGSCGARSPSARTRRDPYRGLFRRDQFRDPALGHARPARPPLRLSRAATYGPSPASGSASGIEARRVGGRGRLSLPAIQHEQRPAPGRLIVEKRAQPVVDDPFRGDVAPQSVFGEFCCPPVRTGPDQMPVLGPSGLVARPLAPEAAVADRSPLVQALFGGNAEHLVVPPHGS